MEIRKRVNAVSDTDRETVDCELQYTDCPKHKTI